MYPPSLWQMKIFPSFCAFVIFSFCLCSSFSKKGHTQMHTLAPTSVTLQPRRLRFLVTVGCAVRHSHWWLIQSFTHERQGRAKNVTAAEHQDPKKSKRCDRWLWKQPTRTLINWDSTQNFRDIKASWVAPWTGSKRLYVAALTMNKPGVSVGLKVSNHVFWGR